MGGLRPLHFSLWSQILYVATLMFLSPYRRGLRPLPLSLRSHILFVATQMFLRPYRRRLRPLHFSLRSQNLVCRKPNVSKSIPRPLHFSLRSHILFVVTQMFLRPYRRGLRPLHFSLRSQILVCRKPNVSKSIPRPLH